MFTDVFASEIAGMDVSGDLRFYEADKFPVIHPVHWLTSHFAVGGWSPLRRLSGMLTAHMTQIAPRNGFTWHPHRGLEIFTYVIDGTLYHEDTTGGKGSITAGEVQRMFSGDYIEHQELNRSDEFARVIQIWFVAEPQYRGLEPHYEQISLADMPPRQVGDGLVRDIIGPHGATNAHVEARLTSTLLPAGGKLKWKCLRMARICFSILWMVSGMFYHICPRETRQYLRCCYGETGSGNGRYPGRR